ncbi:uncharacterized protein N7484_002516 [Penicillium longicatenatum]|uniref:uncharacterized protein n=1 Tax=Penicillium longicatenatum TaxID=1561947 RepID=UPI002548A340|nr:uncharacterized protein N7484_002516 [Penicillium longicatenatum]KAJ5648793.1 hypothetical protein N7484_002516 [Penicillium longicatenatum]
MSHECYRLLMQAKDLIDESHQHFQRHNGFLERGCTFSVEKYCYEPLDAEDTIRLLEFENEEGHMGFIRCQMKHVRLTDEPIYEALSYAWGDPIPTITVICNDRIFKVSANLESALFRLQQTAVPFWIDAICINQTDNAERSKQVKMMSHIYQKARRVNIWLGESDGETWAPLSPTYSLLKIPAVLASTGRRNCLEMTPLELRKHLAISGSGDPAVESFFRLMMRPWFRRIWIIQEVAVSREAWVWCGRFAVQWKDFALALKYAKEAGLATKINGNLFERVHRIELVRQEVADSNFTQRDVHHLLFRYYDFLATNRKDKVYAVLGLAKEPIVNVDYGLDDRQVYIDAAVEILRRSENFDLLGACRIPLGYTRTALSNLPSWVPDWSVSKPFMPLRMQGLPQEQEFAGFSASGPYFRYPPSFSDDQERLCLYGHFTDKIELSTNSMVPKAAPALAPRGFEFSYLDFIRHTYHLLQAAGTWVRLISQQPDDMYITGETVKEALLQTMCCGQADDNFRNQYGHNRAIHRLRNYILANALRSEMTFVTFLILYTVFYQLLRTLCCINIHEVHSEDVEECSDDAHRATGA